MQNFKRRGRDLGVIIFIVILIYIIISIFTHKSEAIKGYQIKRGTLSENRTYRGIALRDETIEICPTTGYVTYFLREGERAAKNNIVYAIDESGKLSESLTKDPTKGNTIDKDMLNDLKQDIQLFSKNFNPESFYDAYSFEKQINKDIVKIENRTILDNINELNSLHLNDIVDFYRANGSGIVTFYYDGFETKKAQDLNFDDFTGKNYEIKEILNDDLIASGSFAYKYINNENWSICINVSNDELYRLSNDDYIKVRFLKTQNESWGKVNIVRSSENGTIVELSFTNSMVTFCKDRFVDIELLIEEENGLKIPNTSIAEKNFYLIDKNFVTKGGNSNNLGVNRKVISDNGEIGTKFTEITVYDETENEYYVDTNTLKIGDVLMFTENEDKGKEQNKEFTVGKQGTLIGVYNINKGYADFKKIEILYSNDLYSILNPSKSRGVNAYDYIALDAKIVSDKDFIY